MAHALVAWASSHLGKFRKQTINTQTSKFSHIAGAPPTSTVNKTGEVSTGSVSGVGPTAGLLSIKVGEAMNLKDEDWIELQPGRLAKLCLRGPQGALDIFAIYFDSGSDSNTRESRSD